MGKPELVVEKVNDKGAQVKLLNVRLTFVNLDKPQKDINGDPDKGKYSVTAIIPKSDFKQIKSKAAELFQQILKNSSRLTAKEKRVEAFNTATDDGKQGAFFKDGDKQKDKTGKVYKGLENAMTLAATMDAVMTGEGFRPKFDLILRDKKNQTIPAHSVQSELYSGMVGHLALSISPYDFRGNIGIKAYLNGVLKVADGDKLSGTDPFANFAPIEDDSVSEPDFGDEDEAPKKAKKRKAA